MTGTDLVRNYIGGSFCDALSGERRPNYEPATGARLGDVVVSAAEDVERAYRAGSAAWPSWSALSVQERRSRLEAWADLLEGRREEIAEADARDTGTPLKSLRGSVDKGVEFVRYFAGLGMQLQGATIPVSNTALHLTVREPFGVVGVITPFNGPAYFTISRLAPVVMAGNAAILKPAEQAPLSTRLIAETMGEVFPPGLVNIVHGAAEAGAALVRHPGVARIHFTGGVSTGLTVQSTAAESRTVKQVTLELGGKNPLIAFPDADPDRVAKAAVAGMNFRRQGQSCGSTSRLFVHESMADRVTDQIVEQVERITVGMPGEETSDMGCVVSKEHQQFVLSMIRSGIEEGARVRTGGAEVPRHLSKGAFVAPTVFDRVTTTMRVAREEIFGPVLSVVPWSDEDKMLEAVNDTDLGLTASIFTRDISKALRTVSRVESGYIWVNCVENRWVGLPYGGYKNSGAGLEHSLETMLSYTRLKSISIALD